MNTLIEILDAAMDEKINREVTPETLAAQEPALIQALDGGGFHSTQILTVLRLNREAIMNGVKPSEAFKAALDTIGAPAKKRYEVWDERLKPPSG